MIPPGAGPHLSPPPRRGRSPGPAAGSREQEGGGGRSLFLGLIGAPYESDLVTTALRMADETVRQGHRVTVWACGYSTALTVAALDEWKPRNLMSWSSRCPSTAAVVRSLLEASGGRLTWIACRYCAQERGTTEQMAGVRVAAPHRFVELLTAADVSMILGVK